MLNCSICENGFFSKFPTAKYSNNGFFISQFAGNQRLISSLVGTSETTRATPSPYTKFSQWLAGIIDLQGNLDVNNNDLTSCEIYMQIKFEPCLLFCQHFFGGSIKKRAGFHGLRWRLERKEGMIKLINLINGEIRLSNRLLQLHRVCTTLKISPLIPNSIIHPNNAWYSGVFYTADSTIEVQSRYITVVVELKNRFGGFIYFDTGQNGYYKWVLNSPPVDYLKENPLWLGQEMI